MSEVNAIATNTQEISNSLDKMSFLKLLITQLKYQDPMSPMENQDFATQLAQFSTVEQLQNINAKADKSMELNYMLTQAINNTLSSTIIGRKIKAIDNVIMYDGSSEVDINFRLDGFSSKVEIVIRDEAGNIIRTLSDEALSKGEHTIIWDGKNQEGKDVSEDTYYFSVNALDTSGNTVSAMPLLIGDVTGIRFEEGCAYVVLGAQEISFSNVIEISDSSIEEEK